MFPADVLLLLCWAKIWTDLASALKLVLLITQITVILKGNAFKVSTGNLLAWLQFYFFSCRIDRAVQLFLVVFSKNSRGRIWQPCSMMYWHVSTAYGERRKKTREKPKPEHFRNILKIGLVTKQRFLATKSVETTTTNLAWKWFPPLAENCLLLVHFRSF